LNTVTRPKPRAIAFLKLPRAHAPQLLIIGQSILKSMTGNAHFPSPTPSLKAIAAAIKDLSDAQVAVVARALGAVPDRQEKRRVLVALLQQLKAYVQAVADANLESSAAIIVSAGMSVRKRPAFASRVFSARRGVVEGSVKLLAPRAAVRASYEWSYSTDGGKTWVNLPVTLQAKTVVTGLVPGSTVHFRYRATTKSGGGNWSEPFVFIVT
jgi:hypothetical protein